MLGSINSHRDVCERLSRAARARVLTIEYRLAPEHPFPAAIQDTVAAYRWLIKQEGLSVLLSEQNVHFAALVADRVYGLEKGEVRWHGTMAAFAQDIDAQRALLGM